MSAFELLFEIGCEELPAHVVPQLLLFLETRARALDSDYQLPFSGDAKVYGTPRRLTLSITGLPEAQKRVKKELSGPPVRAAFDAAGKPTKAAEGFSKTAGVPIDKLQRKQTPKGEYLFAEVEEGGEASAKVIERFLHDTLANMPFQKSMRWGDEDVRFARPVQWLAAVLTSSAGSAVVPVKFGALSAQSFSRGHRFMANEPFKLTTRDDYLAKLRERFVIADPDERKKRVLDEARRAAREAGGALFYDREGSDLPDDPLLRATYFDGLLSEVLYLCETPFAVFGTFDGKALELPREVVLAAMRNHQRYFAVCNKAGALLPAFVTIAASRVKDPALVRRGNERVLKARLADASYFFTEDQKRPFHTRTTDLKSVTYHKKIGSSYEKVERVLRLAQAVAAALGKGSAPLGALDTHLGEKAAGADFSATLARAVALAKADLTTLMVGEFPELQGIVGAHYAKRAGESDAVVEAIRDHYRPRSAEDKPPEGEIAAIVALADKLDTIAGIVAIGQLPTGSSDPFGLRRAALGVIRTLLAQRWDLDVAALLDHALLGFSLRFDPAEAKTKAHAFLADRLLHHLLPEKPGPDADAVRAAVSAGAARPVDTAERVQALQAFLAEPEYKDLAATLKRVMNILKETPSGEVEAARLSAPEEKALHTATQTVALDTKKSAPGHAGYHATLKAIATVRPKVDAFFDAVMVMDKDAAVRSNRLRLLRDVAALLSPIADIEKLP